MNNKPHNNVAKEKMRNARLGKHMHSDETKEKMRQAKLSKPSNIAKKVYILSVIDNIEYVFNSIAQAADFLKTTAYKLKKNNIKNYDIRISLNEFTRGQH